MLVKKKYKSLTEVKEKCFQKHAWLWIRAESAN